ncbi:hypothetical protein E2542_SST25376 [Spatholobus suberectus]|nr:hypothetical protein E2542_SST25376 [Spatholobus suberectus]
MKKKLAACTRDDLNLQEELSEACRIKAALQTLMRERKQCGSRVAETRETTKQCGSGVVSNGSERLKRERQRVAEMRKGGLLRQKAMFTNHNKSDL